MAIRAVLFDLDRTLMDRDSAFTAFASAQYARFHNRLEGVEEQTYVEAFIRLDDRGMRWKDEVYRMLVEELELSSIAWEELFQDFTHRVADHYTAFPGAKEALEGLSHGYLLGLITNGRTFFQQRTINTIGIAHLFQTILISEKEGLRKPDSAIFRRALDQLGIHPHEAVYVGDHPRNDMQAALDVGMLAVWKANADFADAPCHSRFVHFDELPSVIRSLESHHEQ